MNKKHYIILGLLILIIFFQSLIIFKSKILFAQDNNSDLFFDNINSSSTNRSSSLFNRLMNKFRKDMNSTNDIYDEFFNDDFFRMSNNPFKEMERMRAQMSKSFHNNKWSFFDQSWDNWYGSKHGFSDIEVNTEDKGDKLIMKLKIPGLQSNSINISVDDKAIKMDCEIREAKEDQDDKGQTYRKSSSYRRFSRMIPVPANVDRNKAEINTKGEEITITFPKKAV